MKRVLSIYDKKEKSWVYVFKDSEGNLCFKHYMQKYRKHKFGNYNKNKNKSKKERKEK